MLRPSVREAARIPAGRLLTVFVPEAALIALREGLEAFLIVGILLGFVIKLGRADARRWVWLGMLAGIGASLAVGLFVRFFLLDTFETKGGGEWFELVAALTAVCVLTYMVFWMWKHTRTLMVGLQRKIGDALSSDTLWVVAFLTFISVLREGLEVVLFYGALAARYDGVALAWSGLVGAAASVAIVILIFKTTVSFNLQKFFGATGVLLVFVAAGLLVHSVHALTALGVLAPAQALWNTGSFVSDEGVAGRVLHALTGYTAEPTLLQAVLYFGYLFGVGIPYLRSLGMYRRRPEGTLRRTRVVATTVVVVLAGVATVWGALHPAGIATHPADHATSEAGHAAAHEHASTGRIMGRVVDIVLFTEPPVGG